MAQWGQGQQQGFQYPMQTGFPPQNQQFQQNPQFQQQNPQFQPQQQQQQQFQPNNGGLLPQQTGFPGQQRMQGFQQPQQTGFQGGSGFLQPQATGFPGGNFQQSRSAPPVPPIPSQFQQPNQQPSFLNFPPPQQPNRLLNASPGFGGGGILPQQTGMVGAGGMRPLVPQVTGYVDPRISMMTQTFMPTNTSAPYGPGGVPQLPQQQTNLVQSIQQHNQAQRGSANQQLSWALTKAEKKNYNNIFRSWDAQNTGFISGPTALEVFGASGLPKDDLARIWTLADIEDRGKLNIAEFHIAMGLIYRRLNGMLVPDTLPQELVPPSARDLEDTVSQVKTILDLMPPRASSPSRVGQPESRMRDRSFTGNSSANLDRSRDATIYKFNDAEPPAGGFYKPRSRHVDRDAVRARADDDSPSADLSDMKRQLASTASRLDRDADERARRTQEDEELDQEMEDLKYRVKRVQDDLDYVGRGPKTASKEEERRRLERELLAIMHERIPEVERKIKARDERKEKEKRQWARDRDRANDRFGRYDSKDNYLSSSRDDDRDRPYSRNSDRDRPYSRGSYDRDDRDRERERDRDRSRDRDRDRDYGSRRPLSPLSREVDYGRTRSPPPAPRSPAPAPASTTSSVSRDPPAAPAPAATPTPSLRSMTPAERQAFAKAEAQRRIQERMAKLGVVAPSSSPALDTSVEDRLAQEKKEAEEKARLAEKQAEEREQARRERLASEKALREEAVSPAPPKPTPTPTTTAAPPAPAPKAAPTPKAAPPPPPAKRGPAPPPPRRGGAPAPTARLVSPVKSAAPPAPAQPKVDEEAAERARQEEALRVREAALRKAKEEREAAFQERLRQLEREEEEAAKAEERLFQERAAALKAKRTPASSPAVETPPAAPPAPPVPPVAAAAATTPVATPAEKSTNPFSRLINQGAASTPPTAANGNGSTNPWAKPASPAPSAPRSAPAPSKSPAPASKAKYPTAPSEDDSDWGDVREKDGDDSDSSDDEITSSRAARANIAQTLFGGMMPRPTSAAASGPATPSPATPAPGGAGGDAPAAPPPPPVVRAPIVVKAEEPGDRNALLSSIQGGLKLRKAVTVDKSGPPVSGRVLGDTAPPAHINAAPRPVSPPAVRVTPPPPAPAPVETPAMTHDEEDFSSRANNRQSVGWFADRAADAGSPAEVHRLPSTLEVEDEEDEMFATPIAMVPEITVNDGPAAEPVSDLMADIDKSTKYHVRSLYAFQGDGPEDLSFGENLVLVANPSRSGGDWWYGTTASTGKAGLFPKTYVEVFTPKKAKAVYSYTGNNPDELPFAEGDVLSIVDTSEDEWWKAEQGGMVFIVPAGYLELEEVPRAPLIAFDVKNSTEADLPSNATPSKTMTINNNASPAKALESPAAAVDRFAKDSGAGDDDDAADDRSDSDSDASDSDYLSFDDDESDSEEALAREKERQLVLEAAGLIVKQNDGPPPPRPKARRPAPAAPRRARSMNTLASVDKELPAPPPMDEREPELEPESEPAPVSHEARLDDAFARYESFKNHQLNLNRLSIISTATAASDATVPASPTGTVASSVAGGPSLSIAPSQASRESESRYSGFLGRLTGSSGRGAQEGVERERRSVAGLSISAPMMMAQSTSGASLAPSTPQEGPSRANSPSFGTSWASLVDKSALEGLPPGERKRQEAIFELIATESAYVRDLQLIVEVFYSSMLPLLTSKETTVVFANVEDLLLANTGFVSSLEERQKDCRLYIDRIGDILLSHLPHMGVYMEYCVNQSTAIQVLQSLRESKPDLALHLQQLRDENPTVRNLDLSSYLLAPMQRVTRYPLLIKQILTYTALGEEHDSIDAAYDMSQKLLEHINETIRDQEGHELLKKISENLWIGQGRLDLTAPTRYMGPRKLIKEGALTKAKSGKKLHMFLCSDIIVLLDENMQNLYRMPIPLSQAIVKPTRSRDETTFQVSQMYERKGEALALRSTSSRDCKQWLSDIENAIGRARRAEERAARRGQRRH